MNDDTQMVLRIDKAKVKAIAASRNLYTDKQLAEAMHVSVDTISSLLNGSEFRSSTWKRMAKTLDCNPLDLIAVEGYPPPHVDAPAIAAKL